MHPKCINICLTNKTRVLSTHCKVFKWRPHLSTPSTAITILPSSNSFTLSWLRRVWLVKIPNLRLIKECNQHFPSVYYSKSEIETSGFTISIYKLKLTTSPSRLVSWISTTPCFYRNTKSVSGMTQTTGTRVSILDHPPFHHATSTWSGWCVSILSRWVWNKVWDYPGCSE